MESENSPETTQTPETPSNILANLLDKVSGFVSGEEWPQNIKLLKEFKENGDEYLEATKDILLGDEHDGKGKQLAAEHLKAYILDEERKKDMEHRKKIAEVLLKANFESQVSHKAYVFLCDSLKGLIKDVQRNLKDTQDLCDLYLETARKYLNEEKEGEKNEIRLHALPVLEVILKFVDNPDNFFVYFMEILPPISIEVSKLLKEADCQFWGDMFEKGNEFCHFVLSFSQLFTNCVTRKEFEHMSKEAVGIVSEEEAINCLKLIIFFGSEDGALFFSDEDSEVNTVLYSAKAKLIKVLNEHAWCIKPHLRQKELEDSPYLNLLDFCVPKFLEGLTKVGQSEGCEGFLENKWRNRCIQNTLIFCSRHSYIKEFHHYFEKYGLQLITDIGFPFIRTFKEERKDSCQNPRNFFELGLDIVDRQKKSHIKASAAMFMETILDKISSIFDNICLLCCEILEFSVLMGQDLNKLPTLEMHRSNSEYLMKAKREDLVEASLILLTIGSYVIPKHEVLKAKLIKSVVKVTKPLLSINDLVLECRFVCLIGYYFDFLYEDEEDLFKEVLDKLMGSFSLGDEKEALTLQCTDALLAVINDSDLIPKIKPMIRDLLSTLAPAIIKSNNADLFSMLEEIFKYYNNELQERDVVGVIQKLVQRIDKDLGFSPGDPEIKNPFFAERPPQASPNEENKSKDTTNKCWNVISCILERNEFVDKFPDVLTNQLKYIFGFLADIDKISFGDDILVSMARIIKRSKRVNEPMKTLFPYLENTLKHETLSTDLFSLIKTYIETDRGYVFGNQKNMKSLYEIGTKVLEKEDEVITGAVYFIQLLMLLKNCTPSFTAEIVRLILENIAKKKTEEGLEDEVKRLLNSVIFACMIRNYQVTSGYLQEEGTSDEVLNAAYEYHQDGPKNILEEKIFIMLFSNLLMQREPSIMAKEKLTKIIRLTTQQILKIRAEENKNRDYSSNSEYRSEDENNEEEKEDKSEINMIIEESFDDLETWLNTFDSFSSFKLAWFELYKQRVQEMDTLIADFSQEIQKELNDYIALGFSNKLSEGPTNQAEN